MERDLRADLEICNRATPGPWKPNDIPYDQYYDPSICNEKGVYIAQTVYDMQSGTQEHNIDADTIFIAAAREGWPYAIERALDAQAEVKHLTTHSIGLKKENECLSARLAKMQGVVETMKAIGKDGMSAGLWVELLAELEAEK